MNSGNYKDKIEWGLEWGEWKGQEATRGPYSPLLAQLEAFERIHLIFYLLHMGTPSQGNSAAEKPTSDQC